MANAIGSYSLSASIMIYSQSPVFFMCYPPVVMSPSSVFPSDVFVRNPYPLSSDITPPLIFSIKTPKSEYKRGEKVVTYVYIQDRSTLDESNGWTEYRSNTSSSSISCSGAVWNKASEKDRQAMNLSSFSSSSALATDGWYYTECLVNEKVDSGMYNLSLLNIFDVYGNGFDNAPFWTSTVSVMIV